MKAVRNHLHSHRQFGMEDKRKTLAISLLSRFSFCDSLPPPSLATSGDSPYLYPSKTAIHFSQDSPHFPIKCFNRSLSLSVAVKCRQD
ncbi:hypothetical protein L6452_05760 [Arctium lappa]|uniref:Uncharacterized protein n=1 Tax=Arctium lappa TaxID=4217 RepID=A0ACB9EHC4_ARCLA|nr:hypothetical protein L6452_05760 [Arctium lappa]